LPPRESEEESFETAEPEMARPSAFEFHLAQACCFLHDELVPWVSLHLDPDWISHPQIRQVVGQRIAAQREETWQSLGAFSGRVANHRASETLSPKPSPRNAKMPKP